VDDVAVVGVVAAAGVLPQPGDGGGHFIVGAADGVVEGEGEFQGEFDVGEAGNVDVGAQDAGAVVDIGVVAAGVAFFGGIRHGCPNGIGTLAPTAPMYRCKSSSVTFSVPSPSCTRHRR
jgi:hypothetical protein